MSDPPGMSDPSGTVGFVGLGHMGLPMAKRLVAAGLRVVGHDTSPEAREAAASAGLEVGSLKDAATTATVLVLMLPGSDAVASVLEQPDVLDALDREALVVDMSSSEPLRTRALAVELLERGVRLLDAPVSGGVSGATAGSLTIMVGAEAADAERVRPFLEPMGHVVLAGPVGAGHAVKALNNLLSATHLWVTSEAMLAGQRFGLDPEVMLSIINASSGRSGSTENKWPNYILPGAFNSGFGLRLMLKDMRIAVDLIESTGVPGQLGAKATELWASASDDLAPTADHTEVAAWLREHTK